MKYDRQKTRKVFGNRGGYGEVFLAYRVTNCESLAREFNFACHSTVLQLSTFPSHPHLPRYNQSVTACVSPPSISSRALITVSTFDTRAIKEFCSAHRFHSSPHIHIFQAQVVDVSLVLRYWHCNLNFGFYRLNCYWTSILANPLYFQTRQS